jgi:hypothetical protein
VLIEGITKLLENDNLYETADIEKKKQKGSLI